MGIHTGDESQRGTADNKEDEKPVCASDANSTSPRKQGWKEEKTREIRTYQHKDLSRIGLISSSSTPNQFQSAPRCFLYLYIYFTFLQYLLFVLGCEGHRINYTDISP